MNPQLPPDLTQCGSMGWVGKPRCRQPRSRPQGSATRLGRLPAAAPELGLGKHQEAKMTSSRNRHAAAEQSAHGRLELRSRAQANPLPAG